MSDPEPVVLRRRSEPARLRYLAGQLRSDQPHDCLRGITLEVAVAVALDALADEMEAGHD